MARSSFSSRIGIAVAISICSVVAGLFYDVFVANLFSDVSKIDLAVYLLSLLLIIDVICKESTRVSLLPKLINNHISWEEMITSSILLSLFILVIFCISIFCYAFYIGHLTNEGKLALYFVLFSISTFISANVQCRLIERGMVGLSNTKNLITYCFAGLVLYYLNAKYLSEIPLSLFLGNMIFILISIRYTSTKYLVGLLSVERAKNIYKLLLLGSINISIGQFTRFFERTILLGLPSGSLLIYYFAFRIFASFQQILAVNITNLIIKSLFSRQRDRLLNNFRISYFIIMVISLGGIIITRHFGIQTISEVISISSDLIEKSLTIGFILFLGLMPQMMMPKLASIIYSNDKARIWLLGYFLISIVTMFIMLVMSKLIGVNGVAMGFVIGIYSTYFFTERMIVNKNIV